MGWLILSFAAGVLLSVLSAWAVHKFMRSQDGQGWLFFGTIPLRVLAFLGGGLLLSLLAPPNRAGLIVAYALGLLTAGAIHLVVALVKLKE